jgi:hypothetical protein
VYRLTWRLPLAGLVAFSHLQFSQIRSRQPYSIVRQIPYLIFSSAMTCASVRISKLVNERVCPPCFELGAGDAEALFRGLAERLIGYAPPGHWKTITFVAGLRIRASSLVSRRSRGRIANPLLHQL